MKRILFLTILAILSMTAFAQNYMMQSTSSYSQSVTVATSAYQAPLSSPGAAAPAAMYSTTNDYSPSHARRIVMDDDDEEEGESSWGNVGDYTPIGSPIVPLLLLAVAFVLIKKRKRMKHVLSLVLLFSTLSLWAIEPARKVDSLDIYYPADIRKPVPVLLSIPGGAYKYVSYGNEGHDVAAYFCQRGIAVAVLKYRLPNGHENIPLTDACRAVELLRDSAAAWNIQGDKIGVMGFSAGGHLAASLCTKYMSDKARPDYGILIYPVISSDTTIWHRGSFRYLLGENATAEQYAAWSIDKCVTPATPPCLIVACEDDKSVPVENSIRMYQALRDQHVPAQLLIMPTGGHGWGWRRSIERRDLIDDAVLQFIWANLGDKKKQTLSDIHKSEVRQEQAQKDWPKYDRYQRQNDSIIANQIPVKAVFLGNSITDHWGRWRPEFFAQYHCAARGISAQTTYQMLCRMQADVIALKPEMVFILAGANDLACNMGPISDNNLMGNIRSMCELAQLHGIRPMLCSLLPHRKFYWNTSVVNPNERIQRINALLKAYAEANGFGYIDYYSAMLAPDGGGMRSDLTPDEVHPYKEAYQIMEDIVRPYINQ